MQTIDTEAQHTPSQAQSTPQLTLRELKEAILKRRRQRIRRATYAYVAEKIIEDTAPDNPYRTNMVLDWWHRVVDPLEAEKFDGERLRYFRERLKEHQRAPAHNAAIRQGLVKGDQLRRVSVVNVGYWRLQIARLTDKRLNFAAATKAVDTDDKAFEQLLTGLIALPRLTPSAGSWVDHAARWAMQDKRAQAVLERATSDPSSISPSLEPRHIAQRIKQLSDPFDRVWLHGDDYATQMKEQALTRKLYTEYSNQFNRL